jgi:hypothetical protein
MSNGGYAPQIIGNTTKTNSRGPQSSSSGVIASNYTIKNSSVTSKMSGIERVGNSSSTGPTTKSGEKSQFNHQINIMNLKQGSACSKSLEQKKPVSRERNLGNMPIHGQTMQQN